MEPLTPKEVNELRRLDPSMLYADEVRGLLATVDALAAALREVVVLGYAAGRVAAVATWLEDEDE